MFMEMVERLVDVFGSRAHFEQAGEFERATIVFENFRVGGIGLGALALLLP